MYAFVIAESEMKTFMNKLLRGNAFDEFEIRGVEVHSFAKFEISAALDKDYLPEAERETGRRFLTWPELKPYIFNIIKGTRRPKHMKFVFSLPAAQVEALHPKAAAYFLNLTFDGDGVFGTTASSEKSFTMDKTIDIAWEEYVRKFFAAQGIGIMDSNNIPDEEEEEDED